ncbi:unnamed protein product [Heligmosomoides polygyrus]|uniref:ATP-dependent DNA helicase n=1 Tax=Heligmosomoides polygyrus TaxID=6339 RepID=A0A183GHI0_HELPZ|nr:unnamed protein product [Heligmosomoides polygyrus]
MCVCAPEAVHRIFGFKMQCRSDAVERLQVHLPGFEAVTFEAEAEQQALNAAQNRLSNLTGYFAMNKTCNDLAQQYGRLPEGMAFAFIKGWRQRKKYTRTIGRKYFVGPQEQKRFASRLLFLYGKGCANSRRSSSHYFCVFGKGCRVPDRRLIFCATLREAASFHLPAQLRSYYVSLIVYGNLHQGRCFFADGPGGSGKTFVYTTIYHLATARRKRILYVAWTGTAANLLPNGRTATSAFRLLVDDRSPSSGMKRQSKEGNTLREVDGIIWDEAPMAPKQALEAVNLLLQDIMQKSEPFGGKIMSVGGDFARRYCISNFWKALNGGNGDFSELAILTPRNVDALSINDYVLDRLSGDKVVFLSEGEAIVEDPSDALNFPTGFLNKMTLTGMPPHVLNLKVGYMVMLLRNLDVANGLCNGTRLIVRSIVRRVLVCEHTVGSRKGSQVLLPRIDCYSSQNLPIRLRRRLSFAMTINKSQGQSFSKVGIALFDPIFAHGQLTICCPFSGTKPQRNCCKSS